MFGGVVGIGETDFAKYRPIYPKVSNRDFGDQSVWEDLGRGYLSQLLGIVSLENPYG